MSTPQEKLVAALREAKDFYIGAAKPYGELRQFAQDVREYLNFIEISAEAIARAYASASDSPERALGRDLLVAPNDPHLTVYGGEVPAIEEHMKPILLACLLHSEQVAEALHYRLREAREALLSNVKPADLGKTTLYFDRVSSGHNRDLTEALKKALQRIEAKATESKK